MSLPPEVRAQYVAIIDDFLIDADLTTVTVKQARNAIQGKVQFDITPHKSAINDLIRERFDVVEAKRSGAEQPLPSVETEEPPSHTNGVHKSREQQSNESATPEASTAKREASSEDLSDVIDEARPQKKRKVSTEDDAALAARLQAEENGRARPTRGGAPRKAAPAKKKKKTPKKKTNSRVTGSDDSDVPSEDKPKKNTGFHKPLNLSTPLADLLGEPQLSRPEVTKRLWKHIKSNDLQDPADKRFIRCDDAMRNVFKQDRVHMFTMTKLASEQMFPIEE